MTQHFDVNRNVYIDRDKNGVPRQLLHFHAPVMTNAATPQLAAHAYLSSFADLLGLTPSQLGHLSAAPANHIEKAGEELRFFKEKTLFDASTVAFYQTVMGIPVWQAGVAVHIKADPKCVLSAQSTRHPKIELSPPTAEAVKRALAVSEAQLASALGFNRRGSASANGLTIADRRLFIYQFVGKDRLPPGAAPPPLTRKARERATRNARLSAFEEQSPTLPLPPPDQTIAEGAHYVCVKVDFALRMKPFGILHWVALLEVESLSVLYLRPFVDSVNGYVFTIDPVTTNGGPLPSANSAALNPLRVSVPLANLSGPAAGTQSLSGSNVQLADVEVPTIAAPTESSGSDFLFDARTNDFAAVNAYHHTDEFFSLMEGMGFTQAGFFGGTTFPCNIDHRGSNSDPNGEEINAHCLGTSGGTGIGNTTFMLADLGDTTNPIGIACDYRVCLHELAGHGVLYNHVSSANFRFSHSAGDGVAAILNDPGSQAADRFETFPWMYSAVSRRHDRTPAGGYGYAGSIGLNPFDPTLDNKGYQNEQILSSAHFRLYQSIGGDSSDLATQRFAARMTVYLIMRAIATLTPATTPADATGWVTALQSADGFDWTTENVTGGAYGKVVRWAFEKQGLFQSTGQATPNNLAGDPPAVDVYIDDGRGGEYSFQPYWWENQNIWNRLAADGAAGHQTPVTNQTNFAYVKVRNRGTQTATGVVVQGFHANPAAGLSYPIDWTATSTTQLSAPDIPPGGEVIVGPFDWVATHVGHECLFMVASATGDAPNTTKIAPGDSMPEWRLVPNDNNIGQRNVFPVSGGGTSGLTSDLNGLQFMLKNPLLVTARMEVRLILPAFLQKLGWRAQFTNAGGSAFSLRSGDSREIRLKIIPGGDFDRAAIPAGDRTIYLLGYAGGMLVGGMSYSIDPDLAPLPTHGDGTRDCRGIGDQLLRCLDHQYPRVRNIRVRKITIDLEFDDCP